MQIFRLELFPAGDGDCLMLSWGTDDELSHLVIDGGRAGAYRHLRPRLAEIAAAGEALELYVLTHIDADHIEGALAFLRDPEPPLAPQQVWFNGRPPPPFTQVSERSMRQGDTYSNTLAVVGWPLNTAFSDGIAQVESAPAPIDIAGLHLTLLSPDRAHLAALGDKWTKWGEQQYVRKRDAVAKPPRHPPVPNPLIVEDLVGPGPMDNELPNGASIAFIAEWAGHRILFGGDAHPDLLAESLTPLAATEGGRYRIDLLKASHHGSAKNTSQQLIELLDCRRIAISTNGRLHGHPNPQAIARFLHFGPWGRKHLYFNYLTEWTRPWTDPAVAERYDYDVHLPSQQAGGIAIDLVIDVPPIDGSGEAKLS